MTNEELVNCYRAGDDSAVEKLYVKNSSLIGRIVSKYFYNPEDVEDAKQEAYFVLLDTLGKYNNKIKFSTFFSHALDWYYIDMLKKNMNIRIPGYRIENVRKLKMAEGRTEKEIRMLYDWDSKTFDQARKDKDLLDYVSFDDYVTENITIAETVAAIEPGFISIEEEEINRKLWKQIDELPPIQRNIIIEHYINNRSFKEIGVMQGEKYHQILVYHKKALKKLVKNNEIRSLAIEIGFHGNGVSHFNRTFTSSTEKAAMLLYCTSLNNCK